jgi:hypothetical protein
MREYRWKGSGNIAEVRNPKRIVKDVTKRISSFSILQKMFWPHTELPVAKPLFDDGNERGEVLIKKSL